MSEQELFSNIWCKSGGLGLKPYNLSDILHILKELEYTLLLFLTHKGITSFIAYGHAFR